MRMWRSRAALDQRRGRDRVADVVGVLVVVEGDGRARRRRGHDLVRDAVAGVRPEVHVQPAIEADRGDHRRRVGRDGAAVDPDVPDVVGGEDRAARGARAAVGPCAGRVAGRLAWASGSGVGIGVGAAAGGWLAALRGSVPAVLRAVGPAVAVGVGLPRVRAERLLGAVRQAVAVRILAAVALAVTVACRRVAARSRLELEARSSGRRGRCPRGRRGCRHGRCRRGAGASRRGTPAGWSGCRGRDPPCRRGCRRDRCRPRSGWSASTPLPGVREAVVVRCPSRPRRRPA